MDSAASIFENAMKWNRDGYEGNDTDCILYYNGSEHLVKFVRYSATEFFSGLGYGKEGDRWDFTPEGVKATRNEMDGKFLHPISSGWAVSDMKRKELYQWGEKEVQKIFKVLKSNKHAKDMKR